MGSVVPTHFLCFFFWILDSEFPYRIHVLRARQEIRCTFCCWPPGPLARRERRAYPLRYVRSEQHSQRACGPQPGGARRRAGICGVAAPRRCHHIACVAAPCICPPGARAKMHTLFPDGPLACLLWNAVICPGGSRGVLQPASRFFLWAAGVLVIRQTSGRRVPLVFRYDLGLL